MWYHSTGFMVLKKFSDPPARGRQMAPVRDLDWSRLPNVRRERNFESHKVWIASIFKRSLSFQQLKHIEYHV